MTYQFQIYISPSLSNKYYVVLFQVSIDTQITLRADENVEGDRSGNRTKFTPHW
jgi:hypothetical protein